MPPASKATTKQDVALAEVERKASREIVLARGAVLVLALLAAALPLYVLQGIVEPLAGRATTVNVNIIAGITLALSLLVNALHFTKGRSRRGELQRQRERLTELERGVV